MHQAEYLAAVIKVELLGGLVKQIHLRILQAELGQPHQLQLAALKLGEAARGQVSHAHAG